MLQNKTELMIQLTYKCNLQCRHCSYGDLVDRPDISFEQIDLFLKKQKPVLVKLSGGEPTISPLFSDAIYLAKKCNARVISFTNGTGNPEIDPDAYWLSVYGKAEWNHKIVGKNIWNQVDSFMRSHKVDFLCSPIFNEEQVKSLVELKEYSGIPLRVTRLLPHGLTKEALSLSEQRNLVEKYGLNDPPNLATCSLGYPPFKCNRKACLRPDNTQIVCTSMVRGKNLCPYFRRDTNE